MLRGYAPAPLASSYKWLYSLKGSNYLCSNVANIRHILANCVADLCQIPSIRRAVSQLLWASSLFLQ